MDYFSQQKIDARTIFFLKIGTIVFKSCVCGRFFDYFLGHYLSQPIKLDSESLDLF